MPGHLSRTAVAAAVLSLPLAACGGDDGDTDDGGPAPEGAVTVVAESVSGFDAESYTADAGEVGFVYDNSDAIPHTLVIEDVDSDDFKLSAAPGGDDQGSVELEAGDYVLYCDVPGHREAGMEAELTVE